MRMLQPKATVYSFISGDKIRNHHVITPVWLGYITGSSGKTAIYVNHRLIRTSYTNRDICHGEKPPFWKVIINNANSRRS